MNHTMCSYCYVPDNCHTMACSSLAMCSEQERRSIGFERKQIPIPKDERFAKYWKRVEKENGAAK